MRLTSRAVAGVDLLAELAPTAGRGFPQAARMEPVMRRLAVILGLTLVAATLGCKHIGGKNDCQAHPGDAAPLPITNPYPSAPANIGPVIPKPGP